MLIPWALTIQHITVILSMHKQSKPAALKQQNAGELTAGTIDKHKVSDMMLSATPKFMIGKFAADVQELSALMPY